METSAATQQPMAGGNKTSAEQTYLRAELEERRERLQAALQSPAADASCDIGVTQILSVSV